MSSTYATRLEAAEAARAAHRSAVGPEHIKYRLPDLDAPMDRRSLFKALRLERQIIPAVSEESCNGERGCNLCARSCPADAIARTSGRVAIQAERCTGCGACVPACPTGAVLYPGFTRNEQSAGLAALTEGGSGQASGPNVAYVCSKALLALTRANDPIGWEETGSFPVFVPCLATVGVADLLECFARGAAAVALVGCHNGCRMGWNRSRSEREVRFVDRLVRDDTETAPRVAFIDLVPDRPADLIRAVALFCQQTRPSGPGPCGLPDLPPDGPARTASLVQVLMDRRVAGDLSGEGWAPFGEVQVDTGACTLCGLCAGRCPTGALSFNVSAEKETLWFQTSQCVACGLCAQSCPAHALSIQRTLGPNGLGQPQRQLMGAAVNRCRQCGATLPNARMLSHAAARLGDLATLCPACRVGVSLLSRRPAPVPAT